MLAKLSSWLRANYRVGPTKVISIGMPTFERNPLSVLDVLQLAMGAYRHVV